jgi:hypothetical protein
MTTANLQSDILNLAAKQYRSKPSLTFTQLRQRLYEDIYANGTNDLLQHLNSLDTLTFNRIASQAYDLQAGGFEL